MLTWCPSDYKGLFFSQSWKKPLETPWGSVFTVCTGWGAPSLLPWVTTTPSFLPGADSPPLTDHPCCCCEIWQEQSPGLLSTDNNSYFYGNSSASPLTMAFRSLLSNRGVFPPSLEPSQQQPHPHRNHLAFCKEPWLSGVSLQGCSSYRRWKRRAWRKYPSSLLYPWPLWSLV